MVTITPKGLNRNNQGFTLVEILVVVAIIGVISAIAYPNYQNYIKKGKRADMMAELQQMASRIEAQKITYKTYEKIPLNKIYGQPALSDGSVNFPYNSAAATTYKITIINMSTSPHTTINSSELSTKKWQLKAEPQSAMASDGELTLDYTGKKCRESNCGMGDQWRDEL